MPFRICKVGQSYAVIDNRTGQTRYVGSLNGARQTQAKLTADYREGLGRHDARYAR